MADIFAGIAGALTHALPVFRRFRDQGDGSFAEVVVMGNAGAASDGSALPAGFDSLPQAITYNGDGTVNTIALTDGTSHWTQTMGYTTGNLTSVSAWVKS